MSSKLNPAVKGKKAVPYCKPGPIIPIPMLELPLGTLPPFAPAWVVAYATWNDWDVPEGPYNSESFQLPLIGAGPKWKGDSGPAYPYLAVTVEFALWPDMWDVTLACFWSLDQYEHHKWEDVPNESKTALKLLPPAKITIPNEDVQKVAVYG